MTKKAIAKIIEEREYCVNGFQRLCGRSVRVKKVRIMSDKVLADVTLINDEDGVYEEYKNCEYPLDLFVDVNKTIGKK